MLLQVRRLRGDGSCFYRAITFQLVFQAVATSTQGTLLAALQQAQKDITFADAEIVHDFAEPLYALLTKQPPTTPDEVVQAFNDYEISNSAVVVRVSYPSPPFSNARLKGYMTDALLLNQFIRLITSSSLRKSADDYLPFLFSYENDLRVLDPETGLPSMENFCANYIEASDSEADHLAIQALSKALDLGFKVAQLDQSFSSANSESNLPSDELPVDFVEMEGTAFTLGGAILLLRPGHYDLLLP